MTRVVTALFIVALLAVGAAAEELTLSVAVSMKHALEEIGGRFARGHGGVVVRYNFAAVRFGSLVP